MPVVLACLGVAPSLAAVRGAPPTAATVLDRAATVRLIRKVAPHVRDVSGWAEDVLGAFEASKIEPRRSNVCAVLAIVRQESGFTANPEVPGLGKTSESRAIAEIDGSLLYRTYYSQYPEERRSLLVRIRAAKTERDLDLAFRWQTERILEKKVLSLLLRFVWNRGLTLTEFFETKNKIRTIGSMQVAVTFAIRERTGHDARDLKLQDTYDTRDLLYTRKGGLRYGILQLLGYRADYPAKEFLFADYNAGRYSSRNAAVQMMVAALTGKKLELDGDMLAYSGEAANKTPSVTELEVDRLLAPHGLSAAKIRADLLLEKSRAFSDTRTVQLIRMLYERKTRKRAPPAIIPQIELHSVKITRRMTTADFARSVHARYAACERVKG